MSRFTVSKCICHKKDFSEIKLYVEKNDISSVSELQEQNYCSCGCGLCVPYIELMLETGETSFEPGAFYKRKSK
jgi:NAD(P)H-nitrite reductase large subunit